MDPASKQRATRRLSRRVRAAGSTRYGRALALQVAGRVVVLAAVIGMPWLVGEADSSALTLMYLGVPLYLPAALFVAWRRLRGDTIPRRFAAVALDVTIAVAAIALVPSSTVAVLAFLLLVVAAESRSTDLVPALTVAAPVVAVAVGAHVVAAEHLPATALPGYAAAVLTLPLVLVQFRGRHTERRDRLTALYRFLAETGEIPDLEQTVTAIARGAQEAVNAVSIDVDIDHDEPSALSPALMGPVIMDHVVTVPLRTGDETLGTLTATLSEDLHVTPDDVALLVDFAEVAALAILRAQAYERELEAERRLDEANNLHSEVMASLTHELRTPLTTVRGFVETLLEHDSRLTDEERRQMLGVANRNASSLSHRIGELLEYSRLEADHVSVEPTRQPLRPAIERVVEDLAGMLSEHKIVLHVPERVWAMVDELALSHIMSNLLSNASKYSDRGTHIVIRAAFDGDDVVVSVTDHGKGVPLEAQQRIFERFERAEGPTADGSRQPGSGIGLAVVRRYVEIGGGRVWIDSVEGVGTTVSFTLPRADTVPPWEAGSSQWLKRLPSQEGTVNSRG